MLRNLFSLSKNKSKRYLDKELIDEFNSKRIKSKHDTFCSAPAVNMFFLPDGKVIACCFNQKYELGTYPNQSIQEIWNGEKARELRKAMHEFDLTKGCDYCLSDINHKRFDSVNSIRFDKYKESKNPKILEFQLSNTCNLQCVMCSGFLSSSIRKYRENLPKLPEVYDDNFVNQLKEFLPGLEFTTFSGGEPFLIEVYYKIWQNIISTNSNCLIKVVTNGTVLNNKVRRILESGNFELTLSLDSPFKEKYEKIRVGANFNSVIENAKYFSEYCKKRGTSFTVNFCPMISNWQDLPYMINLCNQLEGGIYFCDVYDPWHLSLISLSKRELEFISKSLLEKIRELELPENENLKTLKLLIIKIEKWAKEKADDEKTDKKNLEDLKNLFLSKINNASVNFTILEKEHANQKLKELINYFEDSPIHTSQYYKIVEKSNDNHVFRALLVNDIKPKALEIIERFNLNIEFPQIEIIKND